MLSHLCRMSCSRITCYVKCSLYACDVRRCCVWLGAVFLSHTKFLVLDECDSLCDPRNGFTDIIQKYLHILNNRTAHAHSQHSRPLNSHHRDNADTAPTVPCQFMFVSASMSSVLQRFMQEHVSGVKQLTANSLHHLPSNLNLTYIHTGTKDKIHVLISTLQHEFQQYEQQQQAAAKNGTNNTAYKQPHVLVFCNTIDSCRAVDYALHAAGITCCSLHGQMPSKVRSQLFAGWLQGLIRVCVSTDVGSRGLDVKSLSTVILFDFPINVFDFLHRVGRINRQGNQQQGKCIALVNNK